MKINLKELVDKENVTSLNDLCRFKSALFIIEPTTLYGQAAVTEALSIFMMMFPDACVSLNYQLEKNLKFKIDPKVA